MRAASRRSRLIRLSSLAGALAATGVYAQSNSAGEGQSRVIEDLRKQLDEQNIRLEALRRDLAEQDAKMGEMRRALGLARGRGTAPGAGAAAREATASTQQPGEQMAQAQPPAQQDQQPVGQAPAQDERKLQVAPIFEQPGVLTPPGKYVLEPSLQYAYSSSNRISLVGYTIIPAILIGLIDVREVKRNTWVAGLTGRWGLTNRFEVEAKVPWVYRSDSVISREIFQGSAQEGVFSSTGKGIGDVEFTARYQINDGGVNKPYYIGTLRYKSRTGKDQFEVTTASIVPGGRQNQLQRELPTGSGFQTLQPGLTVLYASDPAVFFGSLSYQYNFKRTGLTQKTDEGDISIGDVEPGSVWGFNFGMGLALNDRSSFSIGYDHSSVGKTKQNGQVQPTSVRTQLGTLLLGYSYRLNDRRTLNVSVGAGLTTDTPDLQLTVRLPMSF